MDALVIVILALVFCITSQRGIETLEQAMVDQEAEIHNLEIKLNDQFLQEEHAFEVIAHGLDFC